MPDLDLPRGAVLALWLGATAARPAGSPVPTAALRGVQGDDEPHEVVDATGSRLDLADALASWTAPDLDVVALLPAPGDVAGVPAAVSAQALDAREVVLLRSAGRSLALVPEVTGFGSALEPGHLVTWHATEVPDWTLAVQGLGTLEDADRGLRRGLTDVTDALVRLDVAHWDDAHATQVVALRDAGVPTWRLPDRLDARRGRILASAARLLAIVDLATRDDGGAVNLWQADQRTAALRDVDRLARRALSAATFAGPAAGPGPQASTPR
ncbi:hypothetical protein ACT17Q_09170 [Cellulomonas sp. CW35]|uniref:hypothetical protein n=1 Tax=Cellulomonas sp. CW35 TaxID=3458249 RepID=UPI00403386E1